MVLTRRRVLVSGAASAALLGWARSWAASQPFTPEQGAQLILLRPTPQVAGEADATAVNLEAFTKATRVPVQVQTMAPEDIPAKNVMYLQDTTGADVCWAPGGTAHLVGDRMVNLTEIADFLGSKYGGWYPLSSQYGMQYGRWYNIPVSITGIQLAYRSSWLQQAGFAAPPRTTDELLALCTALQRIGHPAGFPFGRSFTEGNSFAYWMLWAFGGKVANENNVPVLDSNETLQAIDYAKALYATMKPAVLAWKDGAAAKAFVAGDVGLTNGSAAIYAQARSTAPAVAADMDYAPMPVGPVGTPTALNRVDSLMIYRFEKYPQASKALITFLLEAPQYHRMITGAAGAASPVLRGLSSNPIWQSDPKIARFANAAQEARPLSWPQAANPNAAQVFANFVLIDMFNNVVSGQLDGRTAMQQAQRQVERLYRYG